MAKAMSFSVKLPADPIACPGEMMADTLDEPQFSFLQHVTDLAQRIEAADDRGDRTEAIRLLRLLVDVATEAVAELERVP